MSTAISSGWRTFYVYDRTHLHIATEKLNETEWHSSQCIYKLNKCEYRSIYGSSDVLTGQKFAQESNNERLLRSARHIPCRSVESETWKHSTNRHIYSMCRARHNAMKWLKIWMCAMKAICNFYEMYRKWFVCTLSTFLQHLLRHFATRWL